MRRILVSVFHVSALQDMLELRPISYGAPYVCDQLSDKGICSAGAFAHPAFLKEHHFENLKSEFSQTSDPNQSERPLTRIHLPKRPSPPFLLPTRFHFPEREQTPSRGYNGRARAQVPGPSLPRRPAWLRAERGHERPLAEALQGSELRGDCGVLQRASQVRISRISSRLG